MSQVQHDVSGDPTQSIMAALTSCYGSLAEPDFRKIYAQMDGPLHRRLVEELRAEGVQVTKTTDENDDVSTQLVLDQGDDQVGLGLSGIGPFAAVLHGDADGRHRWVTRPDEAPTPLAARIAAAVERAGFKLLDRKTVARTIRMNRADGTVEATLYQALFTDSDRVP